MPHNLKSLAQTVIRGEPAVKFPLRYIKNKKRINDSNGWMIVNTNLIQMTYHPNGNKEAAKLQDALGQCLVDIINREAKKQGLY